MKQIDHRKITKEVAERIAPTADLRLLIAASGEHPDLVREGSCSHHSIHNLKQVNSSIHKARREFLREPFSREFQVSLGMALHYIQDLFTIWVPDLSIQDESLKELHNHIEAKFPKYTAEIAYEGFNPTPLQGEHEVFSFVRESIQSVSSPQQVLSNPRPALETCFKTCLSVADAVCNNEKGFSKGVEAVEASNNVEALMKRIGERLDEMPEAVNATVLQTQEYLRTVGAKQEAYQWRRKSSVHREVYPDAPLKSHLRKLSDMEGWENELSENVAKLKEIIESGYEQDYRIRQDGLGWYSLKQTEFKTEFRAAQELKTLVSRADKELGLAKKKRRELELRIRAERARINTMFKGNQIEQLLDFGRTGLDSHYYEEARKCFKQVLELDTSNQEARDGLARIDEIFSHRTAAPVEPIQVEQVEPPRKIEPKMENRIEKLVAFGQMALEQGWYDKARENFQQALGLDPTNQEAMKGLARANEILNRSRPMPVKPTKPEAEPARPRRMDEPTIRRKGKKRWLVLAVIPVVLAVVFAYPRVAPMVLPTATPVPTPTPVPTATPVPTPTPVPTATPVPTPTPDYTVFCRDLGGYFEGASRLMDAMPAIAQTGNLEANQKLYEAWLLLSPPEIARPFHEYMLKAQEEAIAALSAPRNRRPSVTLYNWPSGSPPVIIVPQNPQPDVSDRHEELMNMYAQEAANAFVPILNALNTYCGYDLKYEDIF